MGRDLFSDEHAGGDGHNNSLHDRLLLAMTAGVGPRLRKTLLDHFGDATAVLNATLSELRDVQGVGPKVGQAIFRARKELDAAAELATCHEHGVHVITPEDAVYPRMLSEIHDPPGVLFLRGALAPQDALCIAIVGSRHATPYGKTMAERLAASLSRAGLTVVSGLARGIDGVAHRAALAAGGRTLAVLGSGVMNIYPPEHEELAQQVVGQGAVISESTCFAKPLSGAFPQRNRIIAGMSLGVIVVEAALASGALITARLAMEQGREVFAVPGRADSRMSHGCHRLIRDGAKLVETADDVLEELGPLVAAAPMAEGKTIHHPAELLLNEIEQAVLNGVGVDPTPIDHVLSQSGVPTNQALATLSVLEMRRLIRRASGGMVYRA